MSDIEDELDASSLHEPHHRFKEDFKKNWDKYIPDHKTRTQRLEVEIKNSHFSLTSSDIQLDEYEPGKGNVIPGHLASPITNEDQTAILFYNEKNLNCPRHKTWLRLKQGNNISRCMFHPSDEPSSDCNPFPCAKSLINQICKEKKYNIPVPYKKRFDELWDMTLENTAIKKYNYELPSRRLQPPFDIYLINFKKKYQFKPEISQHLIKLFEEKLKAEYIKDLICNKKIIMSKLMLSSPSFVYDKETIAYVCPVHKDIRLMPVSHFISVLDTIQTEFSISLSWALSDIDKKYGEKSIWKIGTSLYNTFSSLRDSRTIPQFYNFLGKWEALILGIIIAMDGDEGCVSLKNEILLGLPIELRNVTMRNLVPNTYENDIDTIRIYLELTGIVKTFGHPCIDMKTSLNVVRDYGGKFLNINSAAVNSVKAEIIAIFCKEYFNKHKHYPKIKTANHKMTKIFTKLTRSIRRSDHIGEEDWLSITFDKNFEFDYSFDTSALIKDSAAAPPFSQWASSFDSCAFQELYNKKRPKHFYEFTSSRVILRYLKGEEKEVLKKVEEIEKGYWDPDSSTASYCRKERELKDEGRVFVKQHYLQRLAQVIREHNIAEQIFPYFEDQTMTSSEAQILKRQELLSNYESEGFIIINIDLSKWNLHFRDALIRPIGKFLDQLFGMVNFFSDCHRWFLLAKIFCNSRLFPPDYDPSTEQPLPGPFFIDNHQGGGEGMCQKFWTLINIAIIRMTAERLGLRIHIMGQGDNQVVIIRFNKAQLKNRKELLDLFMRILKENFELVGLVLKSQETWYSKKLFEYGKMRYFQGLVVSMLTKRAARLIPDINDGVSTFQSHLAQINTCTESAAKTEYSCEIPYLLNQFETLNFLYRSKVCKDSDNRNDKVKYLYFPTLFGGFPSSLYYNHSIRGNDDPLPQWLCLYRDLSWINPALFRHVMKITDFQARYRKDYQQLLTDIRSLNVKPLPSIETYVKDTTAHFLRNYTDYVSNPEIRKLFDPDYSVPIDKIVEILVKMKPLFLPLAHEILRLSNAGVLLNLQNKMVNISTISNLVSTIYDYDFHGQAVLMTQIIVEILRSRLVLEQPEIISQIKNYMICPTSMATKLRLQHWELPLLTPTKPTQNHQFELKPWDDCTPLERARAINVSVSQSFKKAPSLNLLGRGPNESYIGNKTKEKLLDPKIILTHRPSEVACYQSLYVLKSWTIALEAFNLEKLIDALLQEKHPYLPESLQSLEDRDFCPRIRGGNVVHRLKASTEKRMGIRNTTPSTGSHFFFSTNTMTVFLKGGEDYTVHFQNSYLYAEQLIIGLKLQGISIADQYGLIIVCSDCTEDVTCVSLDIPDNHLVPGRPNSALPAPQRMFNISDVGGADTLRLVMSFLVGRQIGNELDTEIYRNTQMEHGHTETGKFKDLSAYFIKTLDFDYCLLGIAFQSHTFRDLILSTDLVTKVKTDALLFLKFSSMLIEAERVVDFVNWSSVPLTKHAEILNAKNLGSYVLTAFLLIFTKKEKLMINNMFKFIFDDISIQHLMGVVKFVFILQKGLSENEQPVKRKPFFLPRAPRHSELPISESHCQSELYEMKMVRAYLSQFIKPRFIYYLGYPSDIVLPAYKEANTLEKLNYNLKDEPIFNLEIIRREDYPIEILDDLADNAPEQFALYELDRLTVPFIHHMSRTIGCISSAASKYLEILLFTGITPEIKPDLNIHLAEGSGSVLWIFHHFFNVPYAYNTWMNQEVDLRRHQFLRIAPASVNPTSQCLKNNKYKHTLSEGETNILEPAFISKFKNILSLENRVYVTIDAESSEGNNNYEILFSYIDIMIEHPSFKLLICKVLATTREMLESLYDTLQSLLDILVDDGVSLKWFLFKPISSHPCNGEVMLILMKPDSFPQVVSNQCSKGYQRMQSKVISKFPFPCFNQNSYNLYVEASKTLRDIYDRKVLCYNPNLKYNFPDSRFIKYNLACNLCCLNVIKYYCDNLHQLEQNLTMENEDKLNLLTRKMGTDAVARESALKAFMGLWVNIFSENCFDYDNINKLIGFYITSHPQQPKRMLIHHDFLWVEEYPPMIYESEEMKNFYRTGKPCTCEDIELDNTNILVQLYYIIIRLNWRVNLSNIRVSEASWEEEVRKLQWMPSTQDRQPSVGIRSHEEGIQIIMNNRS